MTMNLWHELDPGPDTPDVIHVIVEIPKGSRNKYEYHKQTGAFKLDRVLYSPVHYPGDYGFIPQTLSQDGDPLDVLVLVDAPTFTGCLMQVRPIGLLEMVDQGVKDEKVLGVISSDPRYKEVTNYEEIYSHQLLEISHFFGTYKDLEGKRAIMKGWHDFKVAQQVIEESHERYNKENKPVK